ncbi:MAG: M28 family peptidase [Verrucomicrobiales bacterium]|nr:M28 family peptidase [Verrucomicrobiales bacterium]
MNKLAAIGFAVAVMACSLSLSACDGGLKFDPDQAAYKQFSGERALSYVQAQTDIGVRGAGSEKLKKTQRYLQQVLEQWGWQVQAQVFKNKTPQGEVEFVNLRVRYAGSQPAADLWTRPVAGLVVSHYESKKFSEFEFVGANDPGSSVAVLLEMARVLAQRPEAAARIELVFFDGEEAFVDYSDTDGLYGSRYYAESLSQWSEKTRPQWGLLLDMVGDHDLAIRVPRDSPAPLVEKLFAAAEDAGLRKYFGMGSQRITDDHVPLNKAGVPTLDIIDMEYAYWHTPGDTVDKLSAESLETVGKVTLLMIEKYLLDKSEL